MPNDVPITLEMLQSTLLGLLAAFENPEREETFDQQFARIAALPQPAVLDILRGLVRYPDGNVRAHAGEVLLLLNPAMTLPWVLPLLYDPEDTIRSMIACELCRCADVRAIDTLCDVVRTDDDGTVRAYAACALGNIGDPRAIATLREVERTDLGVDYEGSLVASIARAAIARIRAAT